MSSNSCPDKGWSFSDTVAVLVSGMPASAAIRYGVAASEMDAPSYKWSIVRSAVSDSLCWCVLSELEGELLWHFGCNSGIVFVFLFICVSSSSDSLSSVTNEGMVEQLETLSSSSDSVHSSSVASEGTEEELDVAGES